VSIISCAQSVMEVEGRRTVEEGRGCLEEAGVDVYGVVAQDGGSESTWGILVTRDFRQVMCGVEVTVAWRFVETVSDGLRSWWRGAPSLSPATG
jgi:hypothetical protein